MPQFYIKSTDINQNNLNISNLQDIKHIRDVLRLKENDTLTIIDDNYITYVAKITLIEAQTIHAEVLESYKSTKTLRINITLAQSILKSSAQDIVIQKATELGAKEIIPLLTKYTVVKLPTEKDKSQKLDRWQKIASESCKQCERADIPVVKRVLTLKELFESNEFDIVLACVERNAQYSLKNYLKQHAQSVNDSSKILVLTGPEGGWSGEELELFSQYNIGQVSLGNLILRAETAAISVLSDIIYEYEL